MAAERPRRAPRPLTGCRSSQCPVKTQTKNDKRQGRKGENQEQNLSIGVRVVGHEKSSRWTVAPLPADAMASFTPVRGAP